MERSGMNQIDRLVMRRFLQKFTEEDYFLPRTIAPDVATLKFAITNNFVKEWKGPKGASYIVSYSLTPQGRLYLRRNT